MWRIEIDTRSLRQAYNLDWDVFNWILYSNIGHIIITFSVTTVFFVPLSHWTKTPPTTTNICCLFPDVSAVRSHYKLGISICGCALFGELHDSSQTVFFSDLCIWYHIVVYGRWWSALWNRLGCFMRSFFHWKAFEKVRWYAGWYGFHYRTLHMINGDNGRFCLLCGQRFLIFSFRHSECNLFIRSCSLVRFRQQNLGKISSCFTVSWWKHDTQLDSLISCLMLIQWNTSPHV